MPGVPALDLLTDALAVRRLTRLVIEDEITASLRNRIFKRWPPHTGSWSFALTCPWCASMWIGLAAVVARRLVPEVWNPVARAAALSDVAGSFYDRPGG